MARQTIRAQAWLRCPEHYQIHWPHWRRSPANMLVFAEVSWLTWIGLRRAQSIPDVRWVESVARGVLQLVVDVLILRSGVAHRANRLAYANQITSLHILGLGMQ